MKRIVLWCGVFGGLIVPASPSRAAPGTETPSAVPSQFSLKTALNTAWEKGPGIDVASAPRSALRDAAGFASTRITQPPTVSVTAGRRAGTFGAGLEGSVTASVEVPLRAVGATRTDLLDASAKLVDVDVRRARLEATLRAGTAWVRLREATMIRALRERGLAQAHNVLMLARKRVSSGVAVPIEVAMALGEVATVQASVIEIEGLETEAKASLRAALSLPADASLQAVGDLCSPEAPVESVVNSLALAKRDNPAVALATARKTTLAREVDTVYALTGPSLGIGITYTREASGDRLWLGTFTVPLPFVDRGGFEAARGRLAVDVAAAHVERTRIEQEHEVRLSVHERLHQRELYLVMRDSVVGPMTRALRTVQTQVELGAVDVLPLLLARQRLFAAEELATRTCGEMRRADLRWMHLVGANPGSL